MGQYKDLWTLQEERVTLSNQLQDVSNDDLKEVVFNNILEQLGSLVSGL